MGRPKRRQREIDQRRRDILDAAARVFARKGFEAASMQEIAAEAGYGTSSLYGYFDNKQAILDGLDDLIVGSSDDLFDVVIPAGLTLRQRLELLLHHQYAWTEQFSDAFLFLRHRGTLTESSDDGLLALHTGQLATWLAANAAPGELLVPADLAATALDGLSHGFFLKWVREGAKGSFRQYVPTVLDAFFGGLYRPGGVK